MANRGLEPRLDRLTINNLEQLQAMANPYHRRIFRYLDEQGDCTVEELAANFQDDENKVEEYLHGLVSIGLIDEEDVDGNKVYLPAAKSYIIGKDMYNMGEGVESIRELLVDRIGDLAQGMVNLGEDYVDRGRIAFNQLNLKEEDVLWARERLGEVIREIQSRSLPTAEGDTFSFRLALFFYPEGKERWLKKS